MTSIISSRDRACLACRIVSGTGLIGIGAYVANQAKKVKTPRGKTAVLSFAAGFAIMGVLRLSNLPPFRKKFDPDD